MKYTSPWNIHPHVASHLLLMVRARSTCRSSLSQQPWSDYITVPKEKLYPACALSPSPAKIKDKGHCHGNLLGSASGKFTEGMKVPIFRLGRRANKFGRTDQGSIKWFNTNTKTRPGCVTPRVRQSTTSLSFRFAIFFFSLFFVDLMLREWQFSDAVGFYLSHASVSWCIIAINWGFD